jgi:Rad3-related DNA helicase
MSLKISEEGVKRLVEQTSPIHPEPGFRKYQKKAVVEIVSAFINEDKELVLLNAPTGAGKSLIIHSAAKALYEFEEMNSFITTPLNTLVDQISEDEFIRDDVITIKGRNNYNCIHPEDIGTDVDKAICHKDSSFECDRRRQCEYYGRKAAAVDHPEAVTNMSYLMAEGMSGAMGENSFGKRDVLFVDECQKLEDFAMNYISFTVSKDSVPRDVWDNISIPPESKEDDMDYLIEWLQDEVLFATSEVLTYLDSVAILSDEQLRDKEKLENFESKVNNFISDIEDNDWVAQIKKQVKKNSDNVEKVVFKPVEIGRFLDSLLWSRGEKIVLSSATIPGGGWLDEINLGGKDTKKIPVPSTFPVENRPIIMNQSVGKMTKSERQENAPKIAAKIKELSEYHEGEKGFVHCRSYNIMRMIKKGFTKAEGTNSRWVSRNVMEQDKFNREESLEKWIDSDKQVFLSVAMDEGIDLEGEKAEWQVLAKTLYKHLGDKRVRYRVMVRHQCDDCGNVDEFWGNKSPYKCPECGSSRYGGEWDWYNRHAAIQLQQAYGRGVRSKEDEAAFYILDDSAVDLIKRNAELFNQWFLEAIVDENIDSGRGR